MSVIFHSDVTRCFVQFSDVILSVFDLPFHGHSIDHAEHEVVPEEVHEY